MKSQSFKIEELVPKGVYEKYGNKSWRFIDKGLIITIDTLKKRFPKGTIKINDWLWGGEYNQSGFRTAKSKYYNAYSMHSMGKAADLKFSDYKPDEVRNDILNNPDEYPYLKGLELETSTWVHVDCRNEDFLIAFKP